MQLGLASADLTQLVAAARLVLAEQHDSARVMLSRSPSEELVSPRQPPLVIFLIVTVSCPHIDSFLVSASSVFFATLIFFRLLCAVSSFWRRGCFAVVAHGKYELWSVSMNVFLRNMFIPLPFFFAFGAQIRYNFPFGFSINSFRFLWGLQNPHCCCFLGL